MKKTTTINTYNFEIYTKNPRTGETGFDIAFINVYAKSNKEAREILKQTPDFDCIILDNSPEWDSVPATKEELRTYRQGYKWQYQWK